MPTAADLQNFAVHSSNPRFANRALPAQSQMEADLATLNQAQLIQKYGSDTAMQLLGRGLNAQADYQNRTTPHRDILGQVVDPVVDVGSGLVNAIGSIPVLGAGILDGGLDAAGLPTTGLGVGGAHLLDSLNSWTQDHLQSRALNIQRGQNAKDNAYTAALNKAVQGEDKAKGDGDLVAGLKRIGRDTIDAVQNAGADPMVLESGVANAVGSVLAAASCRLGAGGWPGDQGRHGGR
jgi:hypothetical protein